MRDVITVKNLVKDYSEIRAIDNLSFSVKEGEILGLLGPNGSGKSTTINCILGLLKYNAGEIQVFGETMRPNSYHLKREIGVVFQEVAVFDELSVYDNIDYFCGLYISDKETRRRCVEDTVKLVGLEEFKKFRPKQLSGGLLRRLNIACGIAHKPKLIFLDEPTVAVDPQSRNHILDNIEKLREAGATVVYTTHYMEEVEILCDRVVIIDKGQVIAEGTNDSLKERASIKEKISVEVAEISDAVLEKIAQLEYVANAEMHHDTLIVKYNQAGNNLENLLELLKSNHIKYDKIFSERPTLNDVFLELTGKGLRD